MKKKGFTLIELLAVIIVLAIITLISTTIVMNIIDRSKTNIGLRAVELYLDSVNLAITGKKVDEPGFEPDICKITEEGNLLCGNIEITVDMKGIKPNKGIVEVKNNRVTYKNLLLNGVYYNKITELLLDNNNDGKPNIADKYTYKVNDTNTFNFYVLTEPADGKVNLIMDRNICNDGSTEYTSKNDYCKYKWYSPASNNNYGPATALIELYNATKDWNNVSDMIMNYTDEQNIQPVYGSMGYTGITTNNGITTIIGKNGAPNTTIGTSEQPLKSRLPKYSEVNDVGCSGVGSCPPWLVENLSYWDGANNIYSINSGNTSGTAIYNIYGYWLLSSKKNTSDHGLTMWFTGFPNPVHINEKVGIRPVITVPVEYLE